MAGLEFARWNAKGVIAGPLEETVPFSVGQFLGSVLSAIHLNNERRCPRRDEEEVDSAIALAVESCRSQESVERGLGNQPACCSSEVLDRPCEERLLRGRA